MLLVRLCLRTSFAMQNPGSRSGPILVQPSCNSLVQGTASSTRCRETNLKRCRCFCPVPTCPASTAKQLALTFLGDENHQVLADFNGENHEKPMDFEGFPMIF